MNLDIVGIAESHLVNNNVLDFKNYKWIGHYRSNIHINAWSGSGGVGFLINYNLLKSFDASVCDNNNEGILRIKLDHRIEIFCIFACVCY